MDRRDGISAVVCWKPTEAIAIKDGVVWQMWMDTLNWGKREWRHLPTLDDAMKQYGGEVADA